MRNGILYIYIHYFLIYICSIYTANIFTFTLLFNVLYWAVGRFEIIPHDMI